MPLQLLALRPRHKYQLGTLLLLLLLQLCRKNQLGMLLLLLLLQLCRRNQLGTLLLLQVPLQRHKHQLGMLPRFLLLQVQRLQYRQLRQQTIRSTQSLAPLKAIRRALAPAKPSHSGGRPQA